MPTQTASEVSKGAIIALVSVIAVAVVAIAVVYLRSNGTSGTVQRETQQMKASARTGAAPSSAQNGAR